MCPSPALVAYIFPADPSLWLIAKTLHATFQVALCALPAVTSGRCAVATTFALAFLPCHGRKNAIGMPKQNQLNQNCCRMYALIERPKSASDSIADPI